MIAREIFSDYSLGADQLGTPNGKVAPYFLQVTTPHFWQAKTPNFLHRTFFVSHAFLCKFVKKNPPPNEIVEFCEYYFCFWGIVYAKHKQYHQTKHDPVEKSCQKKVPRPHVYSPSFHYCPDFCPGWRGQCALNQRTNMQPV